MKKKYLIAGIVIAVCILCAAIIYAAVRFAPLFQAARTLGQIAGAKSIEYEVDITLNPESLSKEQEQYLSAIAWILETDEESCMNWNVRGFISEARGYAQIFCDGLEGAVTDAYFGEDYAVVNVRMLYETIQENFDSAHPILGKLLPDWQYSDYISLEQIEKIFDTDIKEMYKLDLPERSMGQDTWKILMLLHGMERQKSEDGGQQFRLVWNDYQMVFGIRKAGRTPELSIQGEDMGDSRTITSYRAEVSSGGMEKIIYPDSVMDQDEIQQFENLWGIVKEIQGNARKER